LLKAKVICPKLFSIKVDKIIEVKIKLCTFVLLLTFLFANFRILLKSFEFSVKVCLVLMPIFKFSEESFLETLKPNSQGTSQNFDVSDFQNCL